MGLDGYNVWGQWPDHAIAGLEIKNKGYIGKYKAFKDLPTELTDFCTAIAPTLKEYRYCNMLSTENRILKDHTSYMNDFCGRQGFPPSTSELNTITNWPRIMMEGARGVLVQPECPEPWSAEVTIDSYDGDTIPQCIKFPKELRPYIKIRRACKIDGDYYSLPNYDHNKYCGAVVATGKTMEEAVKKCKETCNEVEGAGLIIHDYALDGAEEEIEKLSKMGIEL